MQQQIMIMAGPPPPFQAQMPVSERVQKLQAVPGGTATFIRCTLLFHMWTFHSPAAFAMWTFHSPLPSPLLQRK